MASGIVACYDRVGAGTETARASVALCSTQTNFGVLPSTDFVDWGLPTNVVGTNPYGLGSAVGVTAVFYDPSTFTGHPDWNARSVGQVVAGVNVANGYSGVNEHITRLDQGTLSDAVTGQIFTGHFNGKPNTDPLQPYGDHLVGLRDGQGPMLINFTAPGGGGISSVGFFISSYTAGLFNATIKAYDHLNPLSSETPFLTYRVTNDFGGPDADCATQTNGPFSPCNDAPFISIDGNSALLGGTPQLIRSIVITTDDTVGNRTGLFIDGLYLPAGPAVIDPSVPEPASAFMIGGGMLLIALASRKIRARG